MFSLESFFNQYETVTSEIRVADRPFHILLPKDLSDFINSSDALHHFPLWAKLWKASWILADFLAQMPVEANKQILEVGGGLGLVSTVAYTFGHRITMTEHNQDALEFAQANAHLNNCAHLPIVRLDWNRPSLTAQFDTIVASEVVYKKDDFAPLLNLFQTCLKPNGEIILAAEMRKINGEFYKFLRPLFEVKTVKKVLRSENEKTLVTLFKLRPKR
jgi:16S rRNA G1207 methylase RsmC